MGPTPRSNPRAERNAALARSAPPPDWVRIRANPAGNTASSVGSLAPARTARGRGRPWNCIETSHER